MSRHQPNLVTALRDAKHFADLWNTASLWKLDAALNRPVEALWEGEGGMRGPGAGLLRALSSSVGHSTVGAFLRAPGSWQLAADTLTEGQRQRLMEHLRGWILQSLGRPSHGDGGRAGEAGSVALEPVPSNATGLRDWARRNQVSPLLAFPIYIVFDELDLDLEDEVPEGFDDGTTVGELLSLRSLPSSLRSLEGVLREWLYDQASCLREALEEERRPVVPPSDPTLAQLFEQLRELRVQLRPGTVPTSTRELLQGRLELNLLPTIWTYADPRLAEWDGEVDVRIEESGTPSVGCDCLVEPPGTCRHVLAAVDAVLRWLTRTPLTPLHEALVRTLTPPSWEEVLDEIEARLSDPRLEEGGDADHRLVWKLRMPAPQKLELRAHVQRPSARGGWTAGTRVSPETLLREGHLWLQEEDRAAARILKTSMGRKPEAMVGALELLARSRRVYLDGDASAPLSIERAPVGLLCREVAEGYDLVPAVQGCELPRELLRPGLGGSMRLVAPVYVDVMGRRCFLLEDAERALTAVSVIRALGTRFPREAGVQLVERLERKGLVLEVPEALQGTAFTAPTRPVVHLVREEGVRFRLDLRVQPLAGGLTFPVGEGPVRIRGTVDGVRGYALRELEAERDAAEALWTELEVPGSGASRRAEGEDALKVFERLEQLSQEGLEVRWPSARPTVSRPAQKGDLRLKVREGRDWFGLQGEVEVDGRKVELAVLLEAARARRGFVRVGEDAFVALSDALREQLSSLSELAFEGREGLEVNLSAAGALEAMAPELGALEISVSFRDLARQLREAGSLQPSIPEGLAASLRSYQEEGFTWLARLASWAPGACLADDMGLGKTLQSIALLLHRAALGPALVVAPTSVCFNWIREAERFAPGLRFRRYSGDGTPGELEGLGAGEVLVVSYGRLMRDAERFQQVRFATAVFDEAQAVKNAATLRARACRDLDVGFRVALTGTPLENHLGELWSLFRVIFPGLLGSEELFRRRFLGPIERQRDPGARRGLARLVQPFLLRRTKREVATELPPRLEINLPVVLSPAEKRLYDEARIAVVEGLKGGGGAGAAQRFAVLAALTRLRMLACHPVLHDRTWSGPASKLARLIELVEELRGQGQRALVFSQFTGHLALVRIALEARGIRFQYLDGSTPELERQRRVEAFQKGEGELFLISLKAGGTGLNLTAAENVIHLDPWWNPAVEDQATDRAHRIGQTRTVTVYRLVTKGTVEEQILALHDSKRELIAGVLDGADAAARLDAEALAALLEVSEDDEEGEGALEELGEPVVGGAHQLAEAAVPRPGGLVAGETVVADETGRSEAATQAPQLAADLLPTITEMFTNWLTSNGRSRGVITSYPRAVERFVDFVQTQGLVEQTMALEPLRDAYLSAVQRGTYRAPASDATLARSALNSLGRLLRNRPAEAVWTSRFVVTQRAAAHGPGSRSSRCFAG